MSFPTDLEIARAGKPKPLKEVAAMMGIGEHLLEPYGKSLAKISLEAIDELKGRPKAKYVVVTAITPTREDGCWSDFEEMSSGGVE